MKSRARRSNKKFWQDHMKGWESSGQSQQAYCREHNLKYTTFQYWRNYLKEKPTDAPLQIVQLKERIQMNQPLSSQSDQTSLIKLWFGPYQLEFDSSICLDILSRLVKILKSV